MSLVEQLLTIFLMALSVMLTRFLAFLAFPSARHTPHFVRFLGTWLPSAVFGMLLVYCLKDSSLLFPARWFGAALEATGGGVGVASAALEATGGGFDWRTLLAVVVTIVLHLWRRSFFLTMAGGTVFYMLLTHF